MSRQGYPKEFRAAAVRRVSNGEPITAVCEDVGVHYNTLRKWCSAAGLETRQYKAFVPRGLTDISKLVIQHKCRIVMTEPGWWECDRCGSSIYWDSCDENDPPCCNYCPNCGSKVVGR